MALSCAGIPGPLERRGTRCDLRMAGASRGTLPAVADPLRPDDVMWVGLSSNCPIEKVCLVTLLANRCGGMRIHVCRAAEYISTEPLVLQKQPQPPEQQARGPGNTPAGKQGCIVRGAAGGGGGGGST